MDMLNKDVREATKKKLSSEFVDPVRLIFFTQEPGRLVLPDHLKGQECLYCRETRQILEEVSRLEDKVSLTIYDFTADEEEAKEYGIDKIPGLVIRNGENTGIRFFGIPSGYEFMSLIEAMVDVSRGRTALSPKTREALQALEEDIRIQVFITPTCPYCTTAVRLAHQCALESPRVSGDMVEATEFPHLAQKYHVFGVPKTVINETVFIEGAVPEQVFLDHILKAAGQKKD